MTVIKSIIIFLFLFFSGIANAQIPTEVPKQQDNSPLDLSDPFELLVLVVLPLLFIVLFFIWRGKKRKDVADDNAENQ